MQYIGLACRVGDIAQHLWVTNCLTEQLLAVLLAPAFDTGVSEG